MSRTLVQPVGQKRLTNVALVRLKKHGKRFEIACFKNKVLSWRSGVEKDLDEVLQTRIVYFNVSKGVLAKSKDLMEAFGTTDEGKICLEILEKGELQVAGKEREMQLSNQFRDIATIVMEKTLNSETERPYTISMIERFMKEVHFAVEPHKTSKKQALDLIRQLQSHFPITRARMRLKLVVPLNQSEKLLECLRGWDALDQIETQVANPDSFSLVCKLEPGHFRACDSLMRDCGGKLEVVSMAVHKEGEDDEENEENHQVQDLASSLKQAQLSSTESSVARETAPAAAASTAGKRCLTCDTVIADAKEFREHYKTPWHKHNLNRKLMQLPPLSAEECLVDTMVPKHKNDMDDYSR